MDTKFSKDLIKGKIAEEIFEQMFREKGAFTVIPFGYEKTVPELINCGKSDNAKKVKKNISSSPDFILISQNKESVYLVEVKYLAKLNPETMKDIAMKQQRRWHPSWIFIATLSGFHFDYCSNIIKNSGKVAELENWLITKDLQDKYLNLLKEFER